MSGFITLDRAAFDHPLLQEGDRFRAWFWMVARACWKPTPFDLNGKIIMLERGQFCTSRDQLAKAWKWSPSAVERFLTRLQTEQMIGRATGQGRSIITICNYNKYQDVDAEPGQAAGQATGQRSDSDRTTKEQGNKGTIDSEGERGASEPDFHVTVWRQIQAAVVASAAATAKRKRTTTSVDHPLPDDWVPDLGPKAEIMVADWPDGMLDREEFVFRNHAASHERLAKNWNAAFRTWLGKADEKRTANANRNQGAGRAPAGNYQRPVRVDGFTAAINRDLERAELEQSAREAGRRHAGPAEGNSVLPFTGARTVR